MQHQSRPWSRRSVLAGAATLTLAATVPGLAACDLPSGRSITPGPAPRPWRDGDSARIVFRTVPLSDASQAALTRLTRAFEADHPGITVELTTGAGVPGDGVAATIAQVDRDTAGALMRAGRLVRLSGWAQASTAQSGFWPAVREGQALGDDLWLWPLTHSVLVQYRNTVHAPERVRAWRDLSSYVWAVRDGEKDASNAPTTRNLRAARALPKGTDAFRIDPGTARRIGDGTILVEEMARANGDSIFATNDRPALDIAGVTSAVKTLERWSRTPGVSVVSSPEEPTGQDTFAAGRSSFTWTGVHERDRLSAAVAGRFAMAVDPFPRGGNGAVNRLLGHQVCVLASASEAEQSAAWTYLEHLSQPAQQRALAVGGRTLPAQPLTLDDPIADTAQQQLRIAASMPGVAWAGTTELLLARAMHEALVEKTSPEQALRRAQRDAVSAMDAS